MYMPGRVPQLKLQLRKMTKKNLQTFIDVEMPEATGAKEEPDEYQTLGQFYKAIKNGLDYLHRRRNYSSIGKQYPTNFLPASVISLRSAMLAGQ
jgi:hypothetical protein